MDTVAPSRPHTDDLRKRQRRQRVADDVARAIVVGVIVFSMLLLLLPLALTVSMSFDARDYLGVFPPPALSTRWYAKFFSDPYLLNGLKTSLQLAALTAVAATALGLSAAVALERLPRRYSQTLMAVFLSPLVVPGVVLGFALLIFYARVGVENTFLRLLAGHVLITFPYAIRTVPSVKKSTKLTTLENWVLSAETFAQTNGSAWVVFVFHHLCEAHSHSHCGPYVISPEKFGAFLDFLHGQASGVVVKTMADVMDGAVKGVCDPVSGVGCDTIPR